jgi:hypothetical protein
MLRKQMHELDDKLMVIESSPESRGGIQRRSNEVICLVDK